MFSNPVEAWAKAEVAKVESKLKSIDADHDGLSDLTEVEKLFAEGVAALKVLEAKVSPAEVAAALNLLLPGKFNAEEVSAAEAAVGKLLDGAAHLQGLVLAAEKAL